MGLKCAALRASSRLRAASAPINLFFDQISLLHAATPIQKHAKKRKQWHMIDAENLFKSSLSPVNPAHEPSRRFSVAPMMDWRNSIVISGAYNLHAQFLLSL
jgi:hypothetical protein